MLKFKISRFRTNPANRELCTTKSDRLGDKRRSRLSPKPLTKRIPPKKHVLTSGNHRPEERSFKKFSFPFFFLQLLTTTSISFPPVGDPNVIGSNNRTNGPPPNGPWELRASRPRVGRWGGGPFILIGFSFDRWLGNRGYPEPWLSSTRLQPQKDASLFCH